MKKKIVLLVMFVVLCGMASAAVYWDNGTGNNNYADSGNWNIFPDANPAVNMVNPNHAIVSTDTSTLSPPATVLRLGNGLSTRVGEVEVTSSGYLWMDQHLYVGDKGTGYLTLNGGTITTNKYDVYIAYAAGSNGSLTMNSGTINAARVFYVADAGTGYLLMNDGTITVGSQDFTIADNSGSTGTVDMHGGTINTPRYLEVGNSGTATLNMYDGEINVSHSMRLPGVAAGTGTVNLNGGTINAPYITFVGTNGLLNVAGGTLVLNGDKEAAVLGNSQIVGFDGAGTVSAVYDGSTYTTVTAVAPTKAYDLAPAGVTEVNLDTVLTWKEILGTTQSTLYLGTDEAMVTARVGSTNKGIVTSPYTPPAELLELTTYYWCVDDSDGVMTSSGDVVSFTTQSLSPFATQQLSPTGTGAPITSELTWTPGLYATESHVYFGSSESDPNFYQGIQTSPFDPVPAGDLDYYTTYVWRVDTIGDDGEGGTSWPGSVVSFTTERPAVPSTATWAPADANYPGWDRLENWDGGVGAGKTSNIGHVYPAIVTNSYYADEPASYVNIGFGSPGEVQVEAGSTLYCGNELRVGYDADGTLKVDGGTVESRWFEVPRKESSGVHGTVTLTNGANLSTWQYDYNKSSTGSSDTTVSSGSTLYTLRDIYVGPYYAASGPHTLTINDAASTVESKGHFYIGYLAGNSGTVTVNDGTLKVGTAKILNVGRAGDGLLIVNGGLVEAPRMDIPGSTGTGHVQLDGGLIDIGSLVVNANGSMDITGGTMEIDGNAEGQALGTYAGAITAYGGWGTVVAIYNDVDDVTTVTAIAPDGSVIEPFEDYDNASELTAVWTATGSTINSESTNVYAGARAMRMDYSGSSSEAGKVLTLDIADIATFDAKALTLSFAGTAGNADLTLSVRLESGTGNGTVDYDASTSLADPDWITWDIDLAAFTGVDLNDLTKIAIVIGDGSASGSGTLYIDQIQLSPSRCISEFATGDVNGDCVSNMLDFVVMSQDWLEAGYTVTPVDPGTTGLVLHYKFDDDLVDPNVVDETGNYDGMALGTGGSWSATGGHDGNGYQTFPGTSYIDIPSASLSTVETTGAVTVSVWVRGDTSEPVTSRQMLFSAQAAGSAGHILTANLPMVSTPGEEPPTIIFEAGHITPQLPEWASYYYGWDSAVWDDPAEADYRGTTWNHFVFSKDTAAGIQRIYHNGQLVAQSEGATAPIQSVATFIIGNFTGTSYIEYHGDVDDFMVFDRALTPDEVLYLAGGSSYFQPLLSDVDFDTSGDIGLGDLEILVEKWLQQQLWPE